MPATSGLNWRFDFSAPPPPPREGALLVADRTWLLGPGDLNMVSAPAGVGKSWLAMEMILRWLESREDASALILSEDGEARIHRRMSMLGCAERLPEGVLNGADATLHRTWSHDAKANAEMAESLIPHIEARDMLVVLDTAQATGHPHDGASPESWLNVVKQYLAAGATVLACAQPNKAAEDMRMSGSVVTHNAVKGIVWSLSGQMPPRGAAVSTLVLKMVKDTDELAYHRAVACDVLRDEGPDGLPRLRMSFRAAAQREIVMTEPEGQDQQRVLAHVTDVGQTATDIVAAAGIKYERGAAALRALFDAGEIDSCPGPRKNSSLYFRHGS
ncbi:MAG: AAA family ATPase [Acidobacteria bacterium]|nr:AAA family ATPase [Acidobacteriota bacterium]